jgi:hypothetical protein
MRHPVRGLWACGLILFNPRIIQLALKYMF